MKSAIYRCVSCELGSLAEGACLRCGARYPIERGILDTLVSPSEEAIRELQGMARENGIPMEHWTRIKIHEVDALKSFEEKRRGTAEDANDYFSQTSMCFDQALRRIEGMKIARALEIGASSDFHFLKTLREKGAEVYAANLQFDVARNDPSPDGLPHRVLADMNHLPFVDESFDLVLLSAVSHHSPCLERTIQEAARILKPGGVILCLNDQISGILKKTGPMNGRDPLIHENYYSYWKYRNAFRKEGLRAEFLFSDFYDRKLASRSICPGQRFERTSRLLAQVWSVGPIREFSRVYLIHLAHVLFGFPLNVILRKSMQAPAGGERPHSS